MKRIETTTKGFSKATKKQIIELLPNAKTFKGTTVGRSLHVRIFDENKVKIAYWNDRRANAAYSSKNGIITIL
tara:strand:+ start:1085 stop:1303 length:219 start_codon:yes stop_codon:yes gene_type:complete